MNKVAVEQDRLVPSTSVSPVSFILPMFRADCQTSGKLYTNQCPSGDQVRDRRELLRVFSVQTLKRLRQF